MSDICGVGLALRIWMWLSLFYRVNIAPPRSPLAQRLLGSTQLRDAYSPFQSAQQARCDCEACQSERTSAPKPERHQRRVSARQARGIMPVGRYTIYYIRRLLPRGLYRRAAVRLAMRFSPIAGFRGFSSLYRFYERLKRAAATARAQLAPLCPAPLSPD